MGAKHVRGDSGIVSRTPPCRVRFVSDALTISVAGGGQATISLICIWGVALV